VYIFSIRDQVDTLTRYGYPGIFLFSLLTSATVILPAPGLIIVFAMGGVLNPVLVALFAGSGATLGELSGFLAGISGRMVVENTHTYDRIREWMTTHPRLIGWTILLLAFLPLPVFDMAGMAAGALRMPVSRFLAWCWVGKIFKMLVVAYLGAASLNLFGLFL
ncbi:MAG: VTT domain-containing protein, partial [Chloroflexi bacterium]|nr:VTT domain-containing protein [Chloroflexota bacterium]